MKFFLASLFLTTCLWGSVRLYNDSPYKLHVVIRAADGTFLGEMILLPEHFNTWSDNYPSFGPGGQDFSQNPSRSQTPYTVQWHCTTGDDYGINVNVPAGGTAIAESSDGPRYCKPPKKKKSGPYGPKEDDEQIPNTDEDNSSGEDVELNTH